MSSNWLLEIEFGMALVLAGFVALGVKVFRKRKKKTEASEEESHLI